MCYLRKTAGLKDFTSIVSDDDDGDDYDEVCVPLGELSVRRQNGVAVDQGGNYILWFSIIIITNTIKHRKIVKLP